MEKKTRISEIQVVDVIMNILVVAVVVIAVAI